jgi:hypothetical protein
MDLEGFPPQAASTCIPDLRRRLLCDSELAKRELPLPNAMYKLNAGKRDLRRDEILESQHRPDAGLDRTMILLDQIIQILRRADRDRPPRRMLGEFSNGPVRGGVAVQRDGDLRICARVALRKYVFAAPTVRLRLRCESVLFPLLSTPR